MTWEATSFLIALPGGPYVVGGYTYRGLGLHLGVPASPKGRRPAKWILSHLGSGHSVAHLDGATDVVFALAREIADAGDWSFDHLEGWRNHFPDAREKVDAILQRSRAGARTKGAGASEDIARTISLARSA